MLFLRIPPVSRTHRTYSCHYRSTSFCQTRQAGGTWSQILTSGLILEPLAWMKRPTWIDGGGLAFRSKTFDRDKDILMFAFS